MRVEGLKSGVGSLERRALKDRNEKSRASAMASGSGFSRNSRRVLAQLQAFDFDHHVLGGVGHGFGGAINDDGAVEVAGDLLGREQLAHVEIGVTHAGAVVELEIIRPAGMEGAVGGNEFALEQ